jgi:hypothetical protein
VSELGPFSPILPVPAADWGDVYDDVMEMLTVYNNLLEAMASTGELRALGNLSGQLEQVERRLGITWQNGAPGVYDPPQQRRADYRVC